MTIQRTFINDVKWLSLAQLFLRLKGFVVIPLMTHALGAWDYGVWTQCVAIATLFLPFVLWGMNNGFTRYASGKDLNEQLSLFNAWLLLLITLTATVSLPVFIFRKELAFFLLGGVDGGESLLSFSIGFCFASALFQAYTAWLKTSGQSRLYSLVLVSQSLFSLVAIIIYLVTQGSLLFLISLTLGFELLFVCVLIIHSYWRYGWCSPALNKIRGVLLFSYPLMPLTFAYLGISWGDRIILLDHMTISEVGVYNLAHGVSLMLVQTIAQPFWAYYPTRFTTLYERGDVEGIQKLYNISAGSFLTLSIPAIAGLVVMAPALVSVLAPDEFNSGSQALVLLVAGYSINILSGYYDQHLQVEFRQKWITISLFICFVLNLILNYFLIPILGLTGAGIASVSAFIFRFLFVYVLVKKNSLVKASLNYIFRVLICALTMCGAVDLLVDTLLVDLAVEWKLGFAAIFGIVMFFALAVLVRVVNLTMLKEMFLTRN